MKVCLCAGVATDCLLRFFWRGPWVLVLLCAHRGRGPMVPDLPAPAAVQAGASESLACFCGRRRAPDLAGQR